MTVNELFKVLQKARKRKMGDAPVQLLVIVGGIPYAHDLEAEIAKKYDGKRVWLYQTGEQHSPEWTEVKNG